MLLEAVRLLEGSEPPVERCQAMDDDHPRDIEGCSREAARNCCCPCIASEERICNALANSVSEAMLG